MPPIARAPGTATVTAVRTDLSRLATEFSEGPGVPIRPGSVSNRSCSRAPCGHPQACALDEMLGKLVVAEAHYLLLERMLKAADTPDERPLAIVAVRMLIGKLREADCTTEHQAIMERAREVLEAREASLVDAWGARTLGGIPWRLLHAVASAVGGVAGAQVVTVLQAASACLPVLARGSLSDALAAASTPALMQHLPTLRGYAQFERMVEALPALLRDGLAALHEGIEHTHDATTPRSAVQMGLLSMLVVLWHVYSMVHDRPALAPRHGLEGLIARLPDHWYRLTGIHRMLGQLTIGPALPPGQQRLEQARMAALQALRDVPDSMRVHHASEALRAMIDHYGALASAWRYNAGRVEPDDLEVGVHRRDLVACPDPRPPDDSVEWRRLFDDAGLLLERMRREWHADARRQPQIMAFQASLTWLAEQFAALPPPATECPVSPRSPSASEAPQRRAESSAMHAWPDDGVAHAQQWIRRWLSHWMKPSPIQLPAPIHVNNRKGSPGSSTGSALSTPAAAPSRSLLERGMPETLAVRWLGTAAEQLGPATSGVDAASAPAASTALPLHGKKPSTRATAYFLAWKQVADKLPNLLAAANETMHGLIHTRFGLDIDPTQAYYCEFTRAESSTDTVTGWQHENEYARSIPLARLPIVNFNALQYVGPDNEDVDAGIYKTSNGTHFDHANEIPIKPSDLIEAFGKVDFLPSFKRSLATYRRDHFQQLRDFVVYRTLYDMGRRTGERMEAGPLTTLHTNIIMAALGYPDAHEAVGGSRVSVEVFDINAYRATNMYVVKSGRNHILVAPGTSERMMFFRSQEALSQWVIDKAKAGGTHAIELEDGFALKNRQDGIFYSGTNRWVEHFLKDMPLEQAMSYVCIAHQRVDDWPRHMADALLERLADDADFLVRSQSRISDEIWENYIESVGSLLPMLQPLTLPAQVAVHVHQLIDAGNPGQRRRAIDGLAGDVLNLVLFGAQAAMEGTLQIDIDTPLAFRLDSTDSQWKLASPSLADQLPLDDLLEEVDLLHRIDAGQGRFTPSTTPGTPGEFIDKTGMRMPAIEVDGQYFIATFQKDLGAYVVSSRHCRWGAIARFVQGRWSLESPLIRARQGIWTLDGHHPSAHVFAQRGTLEKVNGYENVAVTLEGNCMYLSDVPGGATRSSALHPISHEEWGVLIPVAELDLDWRHVPGPAEQRWLEQSVVDHLDPAHLLPDVDRRIYTDIDGRRYVPLVKGYLPVDKQADRSLHVADGGPAVMLGADGTLRFERSTLPYAMPTASSDDLQEICEALGMAGMPSKASHGMSLLTAMRRIGFRGTASALAEWIRSPRTLPLELIDGAMLVMDGASGAEATDALLMQNNLANFDALVARLPDEDVVSAVLEDPASRGLKVINIVPYRYLHDPELAHLHVAASPVDGASPIQVLVDAASRQGLRIRQVASQRAPTLADHAIVYCLSPDAVFVSPELPALGERTRWQTLDTARKFELDTSACTSRQARAPGCATWHTVIDHTLLSDQARQSQALNHQIVTSDERSGLLAHDNRLYQSDPVLRSLTLKPNAEDGGPLEPLIPLAEVQGVMRHGVSFGVDSGRTPMKLKIHTRVVSLGPIVSGVADSRILRASYLVNHVWGGNRQFLVVEPMPGLFYQCEISTLLRRGDPVHVPVTFKKLSLDNEESLNLLSMHILRWNDLQGDKAMPLPMSLEQLPEVEELHDLMAQNNYRKDWIDNFLSRYQLSLTSRAFRSRLMRRLKREDASADKLAALPLPAVTFAPAGVGTPAQINAYYAKEAAQLIEAHFRATGIRSANQQVGQEPIRQPLAESAVTFLQTKGRYGFPDYTDLILRMGAGNCGEMAAVAASLIANAGGNAQLWHLSDIHAFAVVGELPETIITADFSAAEWEDNQVVDPWIGWFGKASEYRQNYRRIMQEWAAEGRMICFEKRGQDDSDWYSPTDPEWLARSEEPFSLEYIPGGTLERPDQRAMAVPPGNESKGYAPLAASGDVEAGRAPDTPPVPPEDPVIIGPDDVRDRDPDSEINYPWLRR